MNSGDITFNSIIDSGLSPQDGACFILERKKPSSETEFFPTCVGGVIAGKTTNAALTLVDGKWAHKREYDVFSIFQM